GLQHIRLHAWRLRRPDARVPGACEEQVLVTEKIFHAVVRPERGRHILALAVDDFPSAFVDDGAPPIWGELAAADLVTAEVVPGRNRPAGLEAGLRYPDGREDRRAFKTELHGE